VFYPRILPFVLIPAFLNAAPRDRITSRVDSRRTQVVSGTVHRLAQPQFDQGPLDPATRLDYIRLLFQPSAAQLADLQTLLADQQNPSSPRFHQWLAPEDFANRFGLSTGDQSKVIAWLISQGFTVRDSARGRNWVAFSGSAGQVSQAFHTSLRRFRVNGEIHYANSTDPSVPEALASVTHGFTGLHDFHPKSMARVQPDFNLSNSHYLAPEDFSAIYNIAPLYQAGYDGTGQSIAVVGASDVLLSDLRAFRTSFNLPANDPKMILYSGTDPGFNGAEVEGNLDLEWASAIAPKATISYVYGPDPFDAMIAAIDLNVAPIITISYAVCEIDAAASFFRAVAQQANAQGITILAASGDAGPAACDSFGAGAFATQGLAVNFPAVLPEVTGVGGTQFVEGTGTYWSSTNSTALGSALSYIPEAAWNESGTGGILAGGGGASAFYPRPSWQNAPGMPADSVRHVPDIALTAAGHDAYLINFEGQLNAVSGTSASTPATAGLIALLNQYLIAKGFEKTPGLGNINPQLYRLAQTSPSVFHDISAGNNVVPCAQGSVGCLTGSYGYQSGQGYDMATGLGSVDANNLVTLWNTQTQAVKVVLSLGATKASPNDTVALTAGVFPASGGTPTGTISFIADGTPLGTSPLTLRNGEPVADLYFPVYLLQGTGNFTIAAEYSGDAAFSSGGATRTIQVSSPPAIAAIIPSWPGTVWPSSPSAQGLSWQTTFSLRETAGVPALITSFTIDGASQPLSVCFQSPNIPAAGTVTCSLVFRNLSPPLSRTYGISGIDSTGHNWSRQFSVNYNPLPPGEDFHYTLTPLIVTQNPSADPSCQWAVQINLDDLGGNLHLIDGLTVDGVDVTSRAPSIFGTERLDALGSLQGTLCYGGLTPPASDLVQVSLSSGVTKEIAVSFVGPPTNPAKLTADPASLVLTAISGQTASATLSVATSNQMQSWTAAVFPANRTNSWLALSQYSGTGPGQITLTASGNGFEPGAYHATIVIQSPDAVPQYLNVPVMFLLNPSTAGTRITSVANPATYRTTASPGMSLAVFGSRLANTTATASGNPLVYSTAGVTATINGSAAPILYASPGQLNLQVPYAVGAGPAVLSVNNNGQIAGFQFDVAPSAPGVFADANGNLVPSATAKKGAIATLFLTGAGEVSPALKTAYTPTSPAAASVYKPILPLAVTVGGFPVFVQSANLAVNQFGITQVTFIVPDAVPAGPQPVVVTIGGISSPPVTLTVQ